jgi:hypothetical protein
MTMPRPVLDTVEGGQDRKRHREHRGRDRRGTGVIELLELGDDQQPFFRVTLPNIKWALLYGVLLRNARAMGKFGAASVVSRDPDNAVANRDPL